MNAPRGQSTTAAGLAALWPVVRGISRAGHVVVLFGSVAALLALSALFLRAAPSRRPPPVPPTMEDVDWRNPESSVYCLACHRQVAPAMAGLDVQRGHSQNVPLDDTKLAAIGEMGTVVGPERTLICMSCHKLGQDASPYMLADTLADSRLCQRCHPGHYAQGTPHDLRLSAPHEKNRLGQTVTEGGPCSACHLSHRYAREIIPSPLDPDGYCITCHQAYHVAAGRARQPMEHPESHCLQCHDPHDTSHGPFLRDSASLLCLRCHNELGGGVAAGMHPLGPTHHAIPAALIDTAMQPAGPAGELTCITCHSMHDANYPNLLRMSAESNALCLACHREQLEAKSPRGHLSRHGQLPVLDADQKAFLAKWGAPTGPNGALLCISCHRVHGGAPGASLLAIGARSDDTCLACHPQMLEVVGSPHDLRTSHPLTENTKGVMVLAGGACSACHLAHGSARPPAASPGDPAGACASCHRPGECGGDKLPGAVSHPNTACTDCHNPHERRSGKFLLEDGAALCLRCHAEQARLVGGPHDITAGAQSAAWPPDARGQRGLCLPCHLPHGDAPAGLYRFPGPREFGTHDASCMDCHLDTAWGTKSEVTAAHPRQITQEHAMFNLALVPADEHGNKRIGCRTCHNAHGAAEPKYLARVGPGRTTEDLCLQCHMEQRPIPQSGHASARLAEQGHVTDSCKPCHVMHVGEDEHSGDLLSLRFLSPVGDELSAATRQAIPCEQCHRAPGLNSPRMAVNHPPIVTFNMFQPEDPAYMPLFGPDGRIHPQGQITCRTCHVSHGRMDLLRLVEQNRELTEVERNALKAHVRPFEASNICTNCHGPVARLLFLYFHQPERRPAAQPGATP